MSRAKAQSRQDPEHGPDLYDRVTTQIIADLQRGVLPWTRPWDSAHPAQVVTQPLRHYVQSRAGDRLFDLGLGPVSLAFCAASSKTDQIDIASLLAAHGLGAFAQAWLRHRGLPWAADLLPPAAPTPTLPEPLS